jgi:branched-chain amino acid transport system permease protein
MGQLLAILLFGLVISGIYALMAIGVALIYGVGRVINFAHGAFYTMGAYGAHLYMSHLGIGVWPAAALSVVSVALIAAVFDRLLIEPLRENEVIVWILTFAFAFVIREGIVLVLGARPYSIPSMAPGSVTVLGQSIAVQRLLIVAVTGVCLGLLWAFLFRTRWGKAMRAVAQNRTGAHVTGISVRTMNAAVMAISAGLAAIAGIIIAPISVITPDMGLEALLMAFTIVIFGGIGSLKGSLIAALFVGYAGTVVSFMLSPELVTFSALILVFAVLLFRPTGLFGTAVERV